LEMVRHSGFAFHVWDKPVSLGSLWNTKGGRGSSALIPKELDVEKHI
jgi:hypothetical protein